MTQANIEFRIPELESVVEVHAVTGANRCLAVAPRIPGEADSGRDRAIEFLADLAAEGRLGALESMEVGRISEDQAVQRIVVWIAGAAGWHTVGERDIHGTRRGDAWRLGRIPERRIEVYQPAGSARPAGVGGLAEEGMPDSVGQCQVRAEAPGILSEVFELVVENVGGHVERGLREGAELAEQEVGIGLFEGEGASAAGCRRPGANGGAVKERGCGGCIGGVEGVGSVVAAGQLVLMLVVVVVDGAELQGVRADHSGHVSVNRVVHVVVVVGTEGGNTGAQPRERYRWHAAQQVRKRQGVSDRLLYIGRLRVVFGADDVAQDRAVGMPVTGFDDQLGCRGVGGRDVVLVPRGLRRGRCNPIDWQRREQTSRFLRGVGVMQKLAVHG